jgi:hypothetical protein
MQIFPTNGETGTSSTNNNTTSRLDRVDYNNDDDAGEKKTDGQTDKQEQNTGTISSTVFLNRQV